MRSGWDNQEKKGTKFPQRIFMNEKYFFFQFFDKFFPIAIWVYCWIVYVIFGWICRSEFGGCSLNNSKFNLHPTSSAVEIKRKELRNQREELKEQLKGLRRIPEHKCYVRTNKFWFLTEFCEFAITKPAERNLWTKPRKTFFWVEFSSSPWPPLQQVFLTPARTSPTCDFSHS